VYDKTEVGDVESMLKLVGYSTARPSGSYPSTRGSAGSPSADSESAQTQYVKVDRV
jgi:hypothetical protein